MCEEPEGPVEPRPGGPIRRVPGGGVGDSRGKFGRGGAVAVPVPQHAGDGCPPEARLVVGRRSGVGPGQPGKFQPGRPEIGRAGSGGGRISVEGAVEKPGPGFGVRSGPGGHGHGALDGVDLLGKLEGRDLVRVRHAVRRRVDRGVADFDLDGGQDELGEAVSGSNELRLVFPGGDFDLRDR